MTCSFDFHETYIMKLVHFITIVCLKFPSFTNKLSYDLKGKGVSLFRAF